MQINELCLIELLEIELFDHWVNLLNMSIFFQWLYLQNDLHIYEIKSSDILFHSSSIAVLSKPLFGWEVELVLFSKTSCKA